MPDLLLTDRTAAQHIHQMLELCPAILLQVADNERAPLTVRCWLELEGN